MERKTAAPDGAGGLFLFKGKAFRYGAAKEPAVALPYAGAAEPKIDRQSIDNEPVLQYTGFRTLFMKR